MSKSRHIPPSLAVVAFIFLLWGFYGVLNMMQRPFWVGGNGLFLDFNVLGIPTFFGLRRYSPGWRTWALFFIWIGLVAFPFLFLACIFTAGPLATYKSYGHPGGAVFYLWVAAICIPFFLLDLWQYRVLTRPDIRALFIPPTEQPA